MPSIASNPTSPVGPSVTAPATVPRIGLTSAEVEKRRLADGFNEVADEKEHPWRIFFAKFWGLSAWMLELIMLLSAILGKYPDLVVVGVLLVANAVVSTIQEHRAAGVVETLRKRLRVSAQVLRDSSWKIIEARELVPGDCIRLRAGDIVPADVKLLGGSLSLDKSAVTGESKDEDIAPGETLPSGAVVRRGEGNGVVLLTGAKTSLGRTTELVKKAQPKLHIDAVIARVVRWLFAVVFSLIAVMAGLSLVRGDSLLHLAPLALVLLLSAVPVALPVMFTVSLAAGSKELARRGVLVTRLSASEDAATMDVLCVDKTGTITMNRLAVVDVVPWGTRTQADVLWTGAGASRESDQDPIDLAFLAAIKDRKIGAGMPVFKELSFKPFDPATRSTEARVELDGSPCRLVKGAVRTLAGMCRLPPASMDALQARIDGFAADGCRTLAVARGPEGGAMELFGLVALRDGIRPDAKSLVDALHGLGVAVKVLTGDELAVAAQIGGDLGLGNIRGMDEFKAALAGPGNEAAALLMATDGLAGVYPEDKYEVVRRLQEGRHITGMTGDGVNDAPALRQAEVGIAVSTATDVAKGAASVVLNEPGLANIVNLIEQGRMIYQRVLTWIINKISRTILKATFVALVYVVTGRFALSALVMLLLTFMTDFHNITLATDHARPSNRPESWNIGGFVTVSAVLGLAMVTEALLFLWFCWRRFGLDRPGDALPTFSFLLLFYFSVCSLLSVRERRRFWSTMPSKMLVAALGVDTLVATGLTFAGLPGLTPLPWGQALAIFAFTAVCCLGVNDAIKVGLIRWRVPAAS